MMIPLPLSGRIVSLMPTEALPFKMAGVANLMYELPENDTTEKVEDMFRALCLIEIPITNHEQNIMKIMTKRRQIVYLVQNPTDCEPSNVLTLIFSTKLIHQIYVVNTDEEYERFLRIRLSGTRQHTEFTSMLYKIYNHPPLARICSIFYNMAFHTLYITTHVVKSTRDCSKIYLAKWSYI